jgi:mannosyltransferase
MINDATLAGRGGGDPRTEGGLVSRSQVTTLGWLMIALLVCLGLGTIHLGKASLWSDEVFSRYYYDVFGLHFMLTEGLRVEPTPPTYAIMLKGWMVLFGDSEASLRSLSVVAYAACLPVVFLLCRELGSRSEALLATFLFALCPTGLYYAQEARTYAITLLPACLLLLASAAFLRDQTSRGTYAAYVVGGTLCVYLHATLVFLVASCAMAVMASLIVQRSPGYQRMILRWIGLNAAVLMLGLPYLVNLLNASQSGGLDWIPPFRLHDIAVSLASLVSGVVTPYPWPAFAIAALCLFVLALSVVVHRPDLRGAIVLIVIPALFLGLVSMVSVVRPILLPRVLCWMVVPLSVLAARQMLRPGRLRYAVIGAWAMAFTGGLTAQEITPNVGKEPWRDVFTTLSPQLMRAGLVVLSPRFDPLILKYYGAKLDQLRIWDERLPPTIMTTAVKQMGIAAISRQQIMEDIKDGGSVWVLSNSVDIPYMMALDAASPAQQRRTWQCGRTVCIESLQWNDPGANKTSHVRSPNKPAAG